MSGPGLLEVLYDSFELCAEHECVRLSLPLSHSLFPLRPSLFFPPLLGSSSNVSLLYCDMTPESRNSEVRVDVHC
jgi:hypothetical protein